MSRANSPQLEDVAVFTQAVEDVFRKLIRFLVGRISLVRLEEMIRTIFVEESENKVKKEHPRKSVSLTKLALMSGLDTRTLIKIRNGTNYGKPFHASGAFLTEFTPGVAILDEWSAKPPFYDPVKKSPRVLKISGEEASFESLFSHTVKSRGVTANSLMNQLAESGSLKVNRKAGTVSLARLSYLPSTMNDQLEAVVVGFSAIGNLIDTVVHNLLAGKTGEEPFFQRGAWTYRLPHELREQARADLRKVLERCDRSAQRHLKRYEATNPGAGQITAGVSLFYFEDSE